jgi:hypothetical protein
MERAPNLVSQEPMTASIDLRFWSSKLVEQVVTLVAWLSVKTEDDSLAIFAFVCRGFRKMVLGWLTSPKADEVFHAGTMLSLAMAGFFVHNPNGGC